MKNVLIATLSLLLSAEAAYSQDGTSRQPVEDFKILMVQAIDSASGEAHGVLVGAMASALTKAMPAAGPVLIDVTTLRRYKQPGCSRLNVRFSQAGVVLPGSKGPRPETLDLGLNYCRDGTPPKSLA